MQTNEKKSGYVIALVDHQNQPISFFQINRNDDWSYGATMREAFVADNQDDLWEIIRQYHLKISEILIMQIEYEFSGKVF